MSGRKAVHMSPKTATKAEKQPKKVIKKAKVTPEVPVEKVEPVVEKTAEVTTTVEVTPQAENSAKPAEKAPAKSAKPTNTTYSPEVDVKELLEVGAHFGHQAKRWHPKMAPYIYAKRDGVHIFDLIITGKKLEEACKVVYDLGKANKSVVFVGTKKQAKDIVRQEATEAGIMFIANRWLGGLISNWEQVNKSNKRMQAIRRGLEDGTYKNYTKLERVVLEKEMQRLERFFGGIAELKSKPDALFIIDSGREKTAVKEANEAGIPVIGFVDSNCDPTPIDFVIPANDDAPRSLQYIIHTVAEAYKAGKAAR